MTVTRSADSVYHQLVCEAGLFGHAFFGWEPTDEQEETLERLWTEALAGAGAVSIERRAQ